MIFPTLKWQSTVGIAVALLLLVLLAVEKRQADGWKKQSENFERLYRQEQVAFATTVANARSAAEAARAADRANAARVADAQSFINQRTADDFEVRLASARAAAQRLRNSSPPATHSGLAGSPAVPDLSVAAGVADQAAGKDRLSQSDRLTATEQAIQLDELIHWVDQQHSVDPNGNGAMTPRLPDNKQQLTMSPHP